MANPSDENSRILGGLVCLGSTLAIVLFLYGLAVHSYWALALPVAALFLFVAGLVFWIGWTIMTVQVEASGEPLVPGGGSGAATRSESEPSAGGDEAPDPERPKA